MTLAIIAKLERVLALKNYFVRQGASEFGLQQNHAEILIYLSQANKYSDNARALTKYLGITKGSVSQSLALLEKKTMIERTINPRDKRSSKLKLTLSGRAALKHIENIIPETFEKLEAVIPTSDPMLETILHELQIEQGLKSFGICSGCKFHTLLKGGNLRCGLTEEVLSQNDAQKICAEYEAAV